jgi:hypothetical protein
MHFNHSFLLHFEIDEPRKLFDCDGEKKKKGQTKLNDIPAIFI